MKKFFTLFLTTIFSVSLFAFPVSSPKKVRTMLTDITNSVTYLTHMVQDGDVYFAWTGDNDSTAYYDIQLGVLDDSQYGYSLISEGVWESDNFDYGSYYMFATSLLLEYGVNYTDYPNIFKEEAYTANVNDDYTLKPNKYVIFIEGLDKDYNVSEEYTSFIFEIVSETTDINSTIKPSVNKSFKYIKDGKVYIYNNGSIYNILGNKF